MDASFKPATQVRVRFLDANLGFDVPQQCGSGKASAVRFALRLVRSDSRPFVGQAVGKCRGGIRLGANCLTAPRLTPYFLLSSFQIRSNSSPLRTRENFEILKAMENSQQVDRKTTWFSGSVSRKLCRKHLKGTPEAGRKF